MKYVALVGLLAVALAGAANAADLPRPPPINKAPLVPAFSWTGCYVGGHVGGLKNDSSLRAYPSGSYTSTAAATYNYDVNDSDFTVGVQEGCNRQFGNLVLGLDSSFSWSGIDQTVSAAHPFNFPYIAYNETLTQTLHWYSTTRGRLGWAQDRWLVFAAGGLASGRVGSTYFTPNADGTVFTGSEAKNRYGWTLGGGLEYALTNDWWLRGEYLYVNLGRFSYTSFHAPPASTFTWGTDVDTRFHVARATLSYRFTTAGSLLEWAQSGFKY